MTYYIGIDPGEHTGVALWDADAQRFNHLETVPLHRALAYVETVAVGCRRRGDFLKVIFEDARKRKWFPQERNSSEYRGKLMGAGANKRDARIWEEFLTDKGIPFEALPPRPGATKWSPEYFARVTGYQGRTSEHARDAALKVYGRR